LSFLEVGFSVAAALEATAAESPLPPPHPAARPTYNAKAADSNAVENFLFTISPSDFQGTPIALVENPAEEGKVRASRPRALMPTAA
jgi:hypothetical protein